MAKIKIGIIGCKNMGGKHLNVLRQHFSDQVEVAGILNSTPESTRQKAIELNVPAFLSLHDITPENVDAVIISTPVTYHYACAKHCLQKSIPCLLEKPFALNEKECVELNQLANIHNTPLLIGYTELYNPAVQAANNLLDGHSIRKIKAIRTSKSYGSNTDSTIISNLMSHDFSVTLMLCSMKPENITDIFVTFDPQRNLQSYAGAKILFDNEMKLKCEADITPDKEPMRIMQITDAENNVFKIDFPDRVLSVNGQETTIAGNSLAIELEDFIACINSGKKPFASAEKALDIEKISWLVEQQLKACALKKASME